MRLNTVFLQGKKNSETCEDGYVFCEHYAAVVDGVTSKSEHLFSGKTPGRIGMEVICRAIPRLAAELTAEEAVWQLSQALYREREVITREHQVTLLEYPRACAAIYSRSRREIWLIGDCQCRINDRIYTNFKKIDEVTAALRGFVLECEALSGKSDEELRQDDPGRQAIIPYLKKQFLFENREGPFGYPVLNGEPVREEQLVVIPVPAGSRVILATDGYPKLHETLEKSEAVLAEMLEKDPFCYRENPQTKGIQSGNVSFDDRCYLEFTT